MSMPIVVVGAGLSGLVCARRLHRAGLPVLVLEKSDRPGGRLRTDVVDGFVLDRGFHTTLTAFRHQRGEIDLEALDLRRYEPGAKVLFRGRFRDVHRDMPIEMAFSPLFPIGDKLRALDWRQDVKRMSLEEIGRMDDEPTIDHLIRVGFSDRFLDRFARPFIGGFFNDLSLGFSKRQFAFIWKMLAEGDSAIPAEGIEAIPRQVVADLPAGAVRFGAAVASVQRDSVRLDSGEEIGAEAVVVATEPPEAVRLCAAVAPAGNLAAACVYFDAPEPPEYGNYRLIHGEHAGLINWVVPVSNANGRAAPAGRALVCATILGGPGRSHDNLLSRVRHELHKWWPDGCTHSWRHLRSYEIPYTIMPQPPGFSDALPSAGPNHAGVYLAGEITANASIDGAIESGRRAADAVLANLGASAMPVGVEA